MAKQQNIIPDQRFIKGLFKDTAHIDQPEHTWRYALNAIVNDKKGSISNEGGTDIAGSITSERYKCIGSIEVNDDKVILFLKRRQDFDPSIDPNPIGFSEIGIWEYKRPVQAVQTQQYSGVYTTLYRPRIDLFDNNDLNFNIDNPIEGTHKVDPQGDLIVYWTDDLNTPRAFNVDRQQRWLAQTPSPIPNHFEWLYGINPGNSHSNHINLLDLFPNSGPVPKIELDYVSTHQSSVTEGGGLLTGVYYLALAYVDEDFIKTNYLTISNPVSIVPEFDHTTPSSKKDGAASGTQTSKSISWKISNLNTDYSYIRPAIIRKTGETTDAFVLNDIELEIASANGIIHSGIERAASFSLEEIVIGTVAYDTAKTLTQSDGVLYLGNLTSVGDLGYQKYANNIKLNSVVKRIDDFDVYYATIDNLETGFSNSEVNEGNTVDHTKSYRWIPNITNYRGYMRDEVYAFYIAFILNDGRISYAYHIPGRSEILNADYSSHGSASSQIGFRDETHQVTNNSDILGLSPDNAKLFQFYDTSFHNTGSNSNPSGLCRHMNYWQNAHEFYPNTDNFEIWDENGDTGTDLKGLNMRHHHFPSNENDDRKSITGTTVSPDSTYQSEITDSTSSFVDPSVYDNHFFGDFQAFVSGQGIYQLTPGWLDTWSAYDCEGSYFPLTNLNVNAQGAVSMPPFSTTGALNNRYIYTVTTDETQINVNLNIKLRNVSDDQGQCTDLDARIRVIKQPAGSSTTYTELEVSNTIPCDGQISTSWATLTGQVTLTNLSIGDKIFILGWAQIAGTGSGNVIGVGALSDNSQTTTCSAGAFIQPLEDSDPVNGSFVRFTVNLTSPLFQGDYKDVKVINSVDVLGFELEDIKIPQSMLSQIQGFRIYRARRGYPNRRILGQSPLIPMVTKQGIVGLCREVIESNSITSAHQTLQALSPSDEEFLNSNPWARNPGTYSVSTQTANTNYGTAYKHITFHDFYLLRTHASLSPSTHFKIEYLSNNIVFNGGDIVQPRKMLTELNVDETSDTGAYKVTERWGWDEPGNEQNCYSKNIHSAMFIGGKYTNASRWFKSGGIVYEPKRLLGQKAKSYVLGNTIFDGVSLGFSGKIINIGGESNMSFGFKDGHELPTLRSYQNLGNNFFIPTTPGSPVANPWGKYMEDMGFSLSTIDPGSDILDDNSCRSRSYIANLHAYKTDVYSSVENQELVWTGFEVTGEDLNYFIFNEDGTPFEWTDKSGIQHTADYATESVQSEGIFGGDTFLCRYGVAASLSPLDSETYSKPEKAIHYHIVESPDNINFRHSESQKDLYFPGTHAKRVLQGVGLEDLTHQDNLKYHNNYSAVNNFNTAFPLPLRDPNQTDFPNRIIRSVKSDATSLLDSYRLFFGNQFKDLPKNRGELWKLATHKNLLYFHMEETLYITKGKQVLQMKDGEEAFVGSGDIFAQDPDELVQTQDGYAGTQSQWAALTTRHGYFFVDKLKSKIFLIADKLYEISNFGMEKWFRDNIPFALENFGLTVECGLDNPIKGFGFHSVWDPKHKRIILTKREFIPTDTFITRWNYTTDQTGRIIFDASQCKYMTTKDTSAPFTYGTEVKYTDKTFFSTGSWTISFFPTLNVWISFHSYVPYLYFNTSTNFYSFTDEYDDYINGRLYSGGVNDATITLANDPATEFGNSGIWKHNGITRGVLYQEELTNTELDHYPFEFEFISNPAKTVNTVVSNFAYTAEVFNQDNINVLEHGFTSFIIYNTFQIDHDYLEYLVNTRRVGNSWTVNRFRDMAALATDTSNYYMAGTIANPNIIGGVNVGTITTSDTTSMFTVNGMTETINTLYIDSNKDWQLRKKFIDKWIGIRLINSNISNNLVNLYSANIGIRKYFR